MTSAALTAQAALQANELTAMLTDPPGWQPLIIVIGSGKGGVGKTTIAMGLAATAAWFGFRTALIDADRLQHSAYSLWRAMRYRPRPYACAAEDDPGQLYQLRGTGKFQIIIVDTPGSLSEGGVLDQSLQWADLILIPSDMSPLSNEPTVDTAKFLARRDARFAVVLNRIQPGSQGRSVREQEAREVFRQRPIRAADSKDSPVIASQIPCLEAWIRSYKAHEAALQSGYPITWYEGPGVPQARLDLQAVFTEVLEARPDLLTDLKEAAR